MTIFRRSIQRYGRTPEPETPFQRAGQLWDERIGSARVQARNWRLMAFGGLGLSTSLAGGLIWQSLQSRVVPYVVAVDRLGEAAAISRAEIKYQPTDPEIAWQLSHFVENVRTVSLDPVLMRRAWLQAYDFTTQRGAQFLNDYARAADPFAEIGDKTVSVQITSVVRASDRSFQVKWIETAFDHGARSGISHWTAILTIVIRSPSSADTLRKNPLGIYVDAIDWSRELEPSQAEAAPPARAPAENLPLGSLDPGAAGSSPQSLNQEVQP